MALYQIRAPLLLRPGDVVLSQNDGTIVLNGIALENLIAQTGEVVTYRLTEPAKP